MADLTEMLQAQEAAEGRVEAFRMGLGPFVVATETTRMPMIFADAQVAGRPLVFANDSFLALTGFARGEILGKDLAFLLGDVADKRNLLSISRALDAGTDGNWQLQCRRVDGSEFLAAIYLSPVRDDQHIIRQHFLSFIELGDQSDGLLAQRAELHALYDKAPGFIAISHGPDHRITFANASYERLLGRSNLVGLTVAEALPETADQGFTLLLDKVFATGVPFVGKDVPITITDADNQPAQRYINFIYQPVRDPRDRITGLFCEGFDVTEQKVARDDVLALQSEVIHLSRVSAMETMATTLAHELNQPLAAIVSYAAGARRLIEAGETGSSQVAEVLEMIGESSERAGEIIRHLRNLTARGTPRREAFELQDAVQKCLRLLAVIGCEDIDIVDDSVAGIVLEADSIQIQQVIINLLRNACEATRDAGNRLVRIATSVSEGKVTVTVTDSGGGVPPYLSRTGFRWTPTSKATGMGVGLSISRTIIDAHDGKLWLESSGSTGSCFAFSLPVIQAAEER